jgi:hypothetical protein
MQPMKDRPIAQAAVFATVFVLSCAVLMLVNEFLLGSREVPWTWYATLWAVVFAPPMVTTVFAAAYTCPRWARAQVLYAVSLIATLVVMEALWLANARLSSAALAVALLCVGIVVMFKTLEDDECSSQAG